MAKWRRLWIVLIYVHTVLKPVSVQIAMPMFGGSMFPAPMPPLPMPIPMFPSPIFSAQPMPFPRGISGSFSDIRKPKPTTTCKPEVDPESEDMRYPMQVPVPVPVPMPMPIPLLPPPQPQSVRCRQPIQTTLAPQQNCPPCPSSFMSQCCPPCCPPCQDRYRKEDNIRRRLPRIRYLPIQLPPPPPPPMPPPPPIVMVPMPKPQKQYQSSEESGESSSNESGCSKKKCKSRRRLRSLDSDNELRKPSLNFVPDNSYDILENKVFDNEVNHLMYEKEKRR